MKFNIIDVLNVPNNESYEVIYGPPNLPSQEVSSMVNSAIIIGAIAMVVGLGTGLVLLLRKKFKKKVENPTQVLYDTPPSSKDDNKPNDETENK